MTITRDRLYTIGWGSALAFAFSLTLALSFRVNTDESEVSLADRQIAQLQQEKMLLATEFEARSNLQQLQALNSLNFGYEAPSASQYLNNERQLAVLGKAAGPDAPTPLLFASVQSGSGGVKMFHTAGSIKVLQANGWSQRSLQKGRGTGNVALLSGAHRRSLLIRAALKENVSHFAGAIGRMGVRTE